MPFIMPPAAIPVAHFRFASRSAYVYPIVFVKLNTSARRTMGRKERLNLRRPTKRRATQIAGNCWPWKRCA